MPTPIDTRVQKPGQWHVFPEQLPNSKFRAFENREDASLLRGAFVVGQNTSFRTAGLPTIRDGTEMIGSEISGVTPIKCSWIFETRAGVKWELRSYDTKIDCRIIDINDSEYMTLLTGLTAGLEFGHANIGTTAGKLYSYFCNGTDSWYRFNGAYGIVDSVTTNTIILTDTIANLNIDSASGSVIIDGVEYAYTGSTDSTLTGVTPDPSAGGVVAGNYALQVPEVVATSENYDLASYKGNVVMAHDGRLHVGYGSTWFYSELDNPEGTSMTAADGEANTKDIEFSGKITAFGKLNKSILCFKRGIIKVLDFIQSGTRLDVPYYRTLTSADDRGTTFGAINQKSTFSTPYGLVFVTPDKRMVLLTGITNNNEPEYLILSDPIQPIFDLGDHTDAVGICVNNTIHYSFKSSSNASANDTYITADMSRQTFDRVGRILPIQWDTPSVGINANDFTAVLEDNETQVHIHSSLNPNSWRITSAFKSDDGESFVTTIRTWAETFGLPHIRKKLDYLFIDIRMSEATELKITQLYDENGVTFTKEDDIDASVATHQFASVIYNPFGSNAFGSQKFGSNPENEELSVYRFYIEVNPNIWFWNISLQISGENNGNNYEVVRFGYRIKEIEQEPNMLNKIGYVPKE